MSNTEHTPKLKPCPFCKVGWTNTVTLEGWYINHRLGCYLWGYRCYIGRHEYDGSIETWNTRAEPELLEENKRLNGGLQDANEQAGRLLEENKRLRDALREVTEDDSTIAHMQNVCHAALTPAPQVINRPGAGALDGLVVGPQAIAIDVVPMSRKCRTWCQRCHEKRVYLEGHDPGCACEMAEPPEEENDE